MKHRALFPYRMDTLHEAESVLSLRSHHCDIRSISDILKINDNY